MRTVIEDADDQKQPAGADAVVDHLKQAALHGWDGQGERAEGHQAEMAHAAHGDQPLHVGLGPRHDTAVEDTDNGQHREERRELERSLREQWE